MFLSSAFLPFCPEMFDLVCILASTKMFKGLKARYFGTPLACFFCPLTVREAVTVHTSYVQCYLKDGHVKLK